MQSINVCKKKSEDRNMTRIKRAVLRSCVPQPRRIFDGRKKSDKDTVFFYEAVKY